MLVGDLPSNQRTAHASYWWFNSTAIIFSRRAWVTNGKDAVVGHFLTHAEPAIVKDLWRIYQDGPPRDQEYELGTPVRVLFDDGLWYAGLVTHFNVATSKYSIQFDDGDQMDMRIPDKDVEVVSRDELEASKKRAAEDDAGGERKACEKEANDGIMLGSNAYRYHNAAGNAAVRPPDAVCPAEGALECEAAHVQRQADEAARVAADDRRRELAAKKKSTFVATAFREPGPKKAAHAARKLGKKSKSVESGKQGKKGMQKKYKFKNKNFK